MSTARELDVWKFVAPEFVFGPETRHMAGRYARNLGLRKVLVVKGLLHRDKSSPA